MKTYQFNYFDSKWPWGRDLSVIENHGLGFVQISIEKAFDFGYIHNLVVHENTRHKGLGKQLLSEAENIIKTKIQRKYAVLRVVPDSWVEQWYRKNGYTDFIEGNPAPYENNGYITLRKNLSDYVETYI